MKKILLIFLVTLLISTSSIAQLNKGMWLAGGSGHFFSYNETNSTGAVNYRYTAIEASATVGYIFFNKFVSGPRLSFSSIKGGTDGIQTNNIQLALGPFLRYYFFNKDNTFNLLTDLCYQLGINHNQGSKDGKNNSFSASCGMVGFFNPSVGLEFLLGYKKLVNTSPEFSQFYERSGLQAEVGFHFYLQK